MGTKLMNRNINSSQSGLLLTGEGYIFRSSFTISINIHQIGKQNTATVCKFCLALLSFNMMYSSILPITVCRFLLWAPTYLLIQLRAIWVYEQSSNIVISKPILYTCGFHYKMSYIVTETIIEHIAESVNYSRVLCNIVIYLISVITNHVMLKYIVSLWRWELKS